MTQAHYKVVFQGEVDTARDVEEVKHNLGVLFKASGDKVDRLFAKRWCLFCLKSPLPFPIPCEVMGSISLPVVLT